MNKGATATIVWDIEQLHGDSLPAIQTVLFGGFQVANIELSSRTGFEEVTHSTSFVDVVFGSDSTAFSGVHRFAVTRNAEAQSQVRICYAHIACNPTVNVALGPAFVFTLHKLYAMWLFREGVVEVMRRLQDEGK